MAELDKPAEDAPITDAPEPTSTEDTQDTDVELEDMDFDDGDIADEDNEETEEPAEAEPAATEEADAEEPADDGAKETEPETEPEPEPESPEEDTTSEEATKKQAAYEAWKQREQKRLQAKEEAQKVYLDEAEDDKDLALRQLQIDAYTNRVERNATKLETGLARAQADIELLREGSPEQREELARRLDDFERMYVTKDNNGDPIDVKADVYEFLKTEAASIQRLSQVGARNAQKATQKTKANTLTPPARKPPEPKVDPDLESFDRVWDD